jgi:hypothetical protein
MGGGFIVIIPIRLTLYTIYMPLPLYPFPIPLKTIARGFLVLFHTGI